MLVSPPSFANSVWRLVRFDLRRHRVLLALVVALELVRAAFAEWSVRFAPAVVGRGWGGVAGQGEIAALDMVMWLAIWVVTAVVVQGDHPSDDRAFWRSRPIPPVALAVAKLTIFAVVFLLVPSIVNTSRLFAYGAPAKAAVAAAIYIALVAGLTVVTAWAAALVTRTLTRFVAACLGVVVALYVGLGAYAYYRRDAIAWSAAPSAAETNNDWLVVALIVASLGLLILHYRLRRPVIAAGAGLGLVLGAIAMPGFSSSQPAPAALASAVSGRLSLPDGLTIPVDTTIQASLVRGSQWPIFLEGRVALPELPVDISAGVILQAVTLRTRARAVKVAASQQCCGGRGAMGIVGAQEPPAEPGQRPAAFAFGGIRAADVEAVRGGHVSVDGEATVVFVRHHLVAAIPLRAGSAFRGTGYLVEVLGVEAQPAIALLRVARFPTIDTGQRPLLSFFEADPGRTRVTTTSPPHPLYANRMGDARESWGAGRHWVDRVEVPINRRQAPPANPQLLIVESRRVGEARTPFAARDVPIGVARPE